MFLFISKMSICQPNSPESRSAFFEGFCPCCHPFYKKTHTIPSNNTLSESLSLHLLLFLKITFSWVFSPLGCRTFGKGEKKGLSEKDDKIGKVREWEWWVTRQFECPDRKLCRRPDLQVLNISCKYYEIMKTHSYYNWAEFFFSFLKLISNT